MTTYTISYDTDYGLAYHASDFEGQSYWAFIASANKAAWKAGILDDDTSVLDCDNEIDQF